MEMEPVDIVLWGSAAKYRDAPIHRLLGTYWWSATEATAVV